MPVGLADSTIKAAMQLAAGQAMTAGAVPAAVAQLVGGEMRTMIFTRLTWLAAGLVVAGSATVGIGRLAAEREPDPNPVVQPPARLGPARVEAKADDREAREQSMNNLRFIGLAMHNYLQRHGRAFPPAAIRKDGKPLLSWRVAILPYLEQEALYNKFHLDEPWDSPHNKPLLDEMPEVYAPLSNAGKLGHSTHCQVFTGPGTMFAGDEGTKPDDIADGTAWTIMVVEAARPVPWTKPEDLPFDAEKPLPELGGQIEGDSAPASPTARPESSSGWSPPRSSRP